MKSKDRLRKALYDVLDWLERERSQHIKLFWSSVFRETIMNHYPVLRMLRNSLMDGQTHESCFARDQVFLSVVSETCAAFIFSAVCLHGVVFAHVL